MAAKQEMFGEEKQKTLTVGQVWAQLGARGRVGERGRALFSRSEAGRLSQDFRNQSDYAARVLWIVWIKKGDWQKEKVSLPLLR